MKKIFNKKFFKVFIITILVLLTVSGTVYIFYSQMTKKQDSFACVSEFSVGGTKSEVNKKLQNINSSLKSSYGVNRLDVMEQTISKLDNITVSLNKYLLNAREYKQVDENAIVKKLNNLQGELNRFDKMMDEYILKTQSKDFIEKEAVNYLYKGAGSYIVAYTALIDEMNNQVSKMLINKGADIKFSVFEIYSNCCKDAFSSYDDSGLVKIKNEHNINFLNEKFEFDDVNSLQGKNDNKFSSVRNKFLDVYSKCNKSKFANSLVCNENGDSYLDFVSAMSEEQAKIQINEICATYYFKKIFVD